MHRARIQASSLRCAGFVAAVLLAVTLPASAATIMSGGGNIAPSQVFSAAPTAMWDMPAGTAITSGTLVAPGSPQIVWSYTGTMAWTGNPLTLDASAGGVAHAYFGAGGTFSIDGTVSYFGSPVYTGSLLTASVSGFEVQESGPSSNNIDIVANPILTVTGGWLSTGAGVNATPVGYQYEFSTTGIVVTNGHPNTDDFSMDVYQTAGTLMQLAFHDVPEPGSLSLLVLGGAVLLRKRRA